METAYFKGEVSPYGWAKVPAYPLCGGSAPATPPHFCQSILMEFCLMIFSCQKEYIYRKGMMCFAVKTGKGIFRYFKIIRVY
jgi:hypothetical protein